MMLLDSETSLEQLQSILKNKLKQSCKRFFEDQPLKYNRKELELLWEANFDNIKEKPFLKNSVVEPVER